MAAVVQRLDDMTPGASFVERRVSDDRRRRYAADGPAGHERRSVARRSGIRRTRLSLDLLTKRVDTLAREIDSRLIVIGVVGAKGRSNYVEVLLAIRGCADEPCRLTIGVSRIASLEEMRMTIRKPVEAYLRRHVH
jgi:hypothetical protein